MRKSEKLIVTIAGLSCLAIAGATLPVKTNHDALVQATINGHTHTLVGKSEMLNALTSSLAYSQAESIVIIHAALVQKYGNKFVHQAQQAYLRAKGNKSNLTFSNELKTQGLTPTTYLYSQQNLLIIKDEIKRNYHVTNSELKTAYESMPKDKYWLQGVYLTDNNGRNVSDKVKQQYIQAFKDGNITKLMRTKHKGYSVSGIGLGDKNINVNQISSNDYANISSYIRKAIKNKQAGEIVSGVDPNQGVFVVKIHQVKPQGSFKENKALLTQQVKNSASEDTQKQTEFAQKVLKELHVRAINDKDLNKSIINLER